MTIQSVSAWFLFYSFYQVLVVVLHLERRLAYMVFDLVLPLGASRNEYELNSLVQYNFEEHAAKISPEFEYAYADRHGIEFEFPMTNSELEAYKIALQGTFNFLNTEQFIHGWQYIGEYHKHSKAIENNLLYLFGYQFNEYWSMLNMAGFRFTDAKIQFGFGMMRSDHENLPHAATRVISGF